MPSIRTTLPSTPQVLRAAMLSSIMVLFTGCASQLQRGPVMSPYEVRSEVNRLLPMNLPDRDGWATDIQVAFTSLDLPPSTDNICAVVAVTQQESSFQVAPPVPGLAKIAREEIDNRASRMRVPGFLLNTALNMKSPTGKTYSERLDSVRTEKDLNAVFDDFISMVPLGQQLFGNLNPVNTGGPMQVSIAFAQSRAEDYPYPIDGSMRNEVFSRRGGMFFGIAHLLDYPTSYEDPLYRFADFNAGWYASRNAAFQDAISRITGIPLELDGDLIRHDSREPGATELAVRSLGRQLNMDNKDIRAALEQGSTLEFEKTRLYRRVFSLADKTEGRQLPRAVVPRIALESPKITRELTTAWFANRVNERFKQCVARAQLDSVQAPQ